MARRTRNETDDHDDRVIYAQPLNQKSKTATRISVREFEELNRLSSSQVLEEGEALLTSEAEEGDNIQNSISNDEFIESIIKTAISRNMGDKVIRRSHFNEGFKNNKMQFTTVLGTANFILDKYFGMKIESLNDSLNNGNQVEYNLVNTMSKKEKEILDKLWINDQEVQINNHKEAMEQQYFLPIDKRDKLCTSNDSLVKTAVISMILSIIIIENNYVNKKKLITTLSSFGINPSLDPNSNFGHTSNTLLSEMERSRYIARAFNNPKTDSKEVSDSHVFYTLGKRAIVEFTPMSFFYFIEDIYGNDFDETIKEKILVTLELAFKR